MTSPAAADASAAAGRERACPEIFLPGGSSRDLRQRVAMGEGAGGWAESLRVKIVFLRQCVRVSTSGPETHTLTLSLVRERASIRCSPGNSEHETSKVQTVFRHLFWSGSGNPHSFCCVGYSPRA